MASSASINLFNAANSKKYKNRCLLCNCRLKEKLIKKELRSNFLLFVRFYHSLSQMQQQKIRRLVEPNLSSNLYHCSVKMKNLF